MKYEQYRKDIQACVGDDITVSLKDTVLVFCAMINGEPFITEYALGENNAPSDVLAQAIRAALRRTPQLSS